MDNNTNNQILSFQLKEQRYAVFIENVKEIIKSPENISEYIGDKSLRGIISYRGSSLPIIDLNERLGYEATNKDEEPFIIVYEKEDKLCGFLVNSVENIQNTSEETLEPVPNIGQNNHSYVETIFKDNNTIVPILKLNQMIG